MNYAKLIDNQPVYAPNPIHIGTRWRVNPPGSVYVAEGYKPVRYTDAPEVETGYEAVPGWREDEDKIVQTWEVVETPEPELSADEALDILLGGAVE